jgi:hypothetical protein
MRTAMNLVKQAGAGLPKSKRHTPARKVLDGAHLADVFGIEMAEVAPAMKPATRRHKSTAAKASKTPVAVATTTTRKASTTGEPGATKKPAAAQKPAKGRAAAKSVVRANRQSARTVQIPAKLTDESDHDDRIESGGGSGASAVHR